jgi:hypothetical protein
MTPSFTAFCHVESRNENLEFVARGCWDSNDDSRGVPPIALLSRNHSIFMGAGRASDNQDRTSLSVSVSIDGSSRELLRWIREQPTVQNGLNREALRDRKCSISGRMELRCSGAVYCGPRTLDLNLLE